MMADSAEGEIANIILLVILWGLAIFLAIKRNEMTAKNYLELGWTFVEPDSKQVKLAMGKLGISV